VGVVARHARASLLALGFLAAALAAEAQKPGKTYRIGVLDISPIAQNAANLDAFRDGLRELGYVEGQNRAIEYRSPGSGKALPELAAEMVRVNVDLILTRGTAAVAAAKKATRTIPIVMAASGDPVGVGLVSALARPGGNVTGLSALTTEVTGKRLQLLKEAIPGIRRVAAVFDRGTGIPNQGQSAEEAARALGLEPLIIYIERMEDLGPAFETAVKRRIEAVVVGSGTALRSDVRRVAALATKQRLPSMFPSREFVDAGGLMAYGVSYPASYRRAATYVDKIFKGANPGELPVEQPTTFEFVGNLRAAAAVGLTIRPSVLIRAYEVIR
jgi:putative ABC transport system substrate-binding protein